MSRLSKNLVGLLILVVFMFVSIVGLPLSVHYNSHVDPICFSAGSHCLNGVEHINNWQAAFMGIIGTFFMLMVLLLLSWYSQTKSHFIFLSKNFVRPTEIYNSLPLSLFRILTQPNL